MKRKFQPRKKEPYRKCRWSLNVTNFRDKLERALCAGDYEAASAMLVSHSYDCQFLSNALHLAALGGMVEQPMEAITIQDRLTAVNYCWSKERTSNTEIREVAQQLSKQPWQGTSTQWWSWWILVLICLSLPQTKEVSKHVFRLTCKEYCIGLTDIQKT